MEVSEINSTEQLKGSRSAKDVYLRILGKTEMPKSPDEISETITIPVEALGSLEESLRLSWEDGLERSQVVGWDGKRKNFLYSPVIIGTETDVGHPITTFKLFFDRKGLIHYHTHPRDGIVAPSYHDLAGSRVLPREGFIRIIASALHAVALLQTEKSARLPFSVYLASRLYKDLSKNFDNETVDEKLQKVVDFAQKEGYGLYNAWPINGLDKGLEFHRLIQRR